MYLRGLVKFQVYSHEFVKFQVVPRRHEESSSRVVLRQACKVPDMRPRPPAPRGMSEARRVKGK